MKDVFGHEAGRRIEFGSRLCRGMVATEDGLLHAGARGGIQHHRQERRARVLMAGTTETALHGIRPRVAAGLQRRRFQRWRGCGGGRRDRAGGARIGHRRLDPHSREFLRRRRTQTLARADLVRSMLDENGYGLAQNFAQTRSLRDTAAAGLSGRAQTGDPRHPAPRPVGCRRCRKLRAGYASASAPQR
jgi:hypothetical protein